MLQFRFAAVSDTGPVREHNEDAGFAGPYLLCVADGVGGAAAGEVASASTAYAVSARALASPGMDPQLVLAGAAETAYEQIVAGVAADPDRTGMATTLTAVLTDGQRFALAHIGDSRCYLLRDGILAQLSTDHTMVRELLDAGQISPAQAATAPFKNVVTRALAADTDPTIDLLWLDLRVGDRLLLCSDGLTDVVADHAIAGHLALASLRMAATRLQLAALEGGGRDNITCLVAEVVDGEPIVGSGLNIGAAADPVHNVVDAAAVHPLRTA